VDRVVANGAVMGDDTCPAINQSINQSHGADIHCIVIIIIIDEHHIGLGL